MSEPVSPTSFDRLLASLRSIIRAEFPQFTYGGLYEYAIQSLSGNTVSCDPVDTSIPLPSLANVELRPSILGESVTSPVLPGSRCIVGFINSDPTRPFILSISNPAGTVAIQAGIYPPTEHVATVEGVVTLIVALLYTIGGPGGLGAPPWVGVGKLFDVTEPTMTVLSTTITTLLTGCNLPLLPTPTAMGGTMLPLVLSAVQAALTAKIPDVSPGLTPTGIGAPNFKTG